MGGRCRFCEGDTVDHARKCGRRIEPGPRDGEREQQRGKARGEVRNARVPHCQGAHRSLKARMISPKPTFQQIGTRGPPARGQHEIRGHDNGPASADREAAADSMQLRVYDFVRDGIPERAKYRASNPGSAQSSTWSPPVMQLRCAPIARFPPICNPRLHAARAPSLTRFQRQECLSRRRLSRVRCQCLWGFLMPARGEHARSGPPDCVYRASQKHDPDESGRSNS